MRKHQVLFYSPGTFVSESSAYDIDSWDIVKAIEMSEKVVERYGAKPYGFVFRTLLTAPNVPDGEGGFLEVIPKEVSRSGVHFLGGKLETYDDVVNRNDEKESILRNNMKWNNNWIICINTNSYKTTMPFNTEDYLVDAKGNIIERGDDPKYVTYRASQDAKLEEK